MAGRLIHKRKNSWLLRIYKGNDPLTKKRIYKTVKFEGDRATARAELDRLLRAQVEGREVTPPDMTVNEYLDLWFETVAEIVIGTKLWRATKESSHLTLERSLGTLSFLISSRAIFSTFLV